MHANGNSKRFYLYTRYERCWHWLQAALIIMLLLTGLETHGSLKLFGFKRAAELHNFLGLTWLVSFAFFVFWIFTTGEWKQYVPTTKKMFEVVRYYLHGIFRGEPHPCPKTPSAKHNPLQRLTYLSLAALLLPLQMATGLAYYLYPSWRQLGLGWLDLRVLAWVHLAGGFALLIFLIVHVYMTTTGHTPFAHLRAMVSGYEAAGDGMEDWEKRSI
jgi:thiosulfate reductase cytochrome b subunit